MEIQAFLLSILLLTILSGSEAKSLDQFCAEKCTAGTKTLFQNNGYEYSYVYRTTVESSFHVKSAQDQKARLSIEVPFTITANSECDLVLQVKRGIFIDNMTPRTQEEIAWQEAVTEYPLAFSWQNGIVEQLCPSNNEPSWVLNFKRGILSALQITSTNNASALRELDVSGDCEADFFVQKGEMTTIRKIKDFTKCTNRDKHLLFTWWMPYELNSPRQNYIHSQQTCRQTLGNVLQSVECSEEHVFRPFSNDEAGARTRITQQIQFHRQRRTASNEYPTRRFRKTDLSYEEATESVIKNMEEKAEAAENLLTEICANMDGEEYQNVGKRFTTLVFAIRELDSESLSRLWAHIDSCAEWKSSVSQMLANSLQFCGTESCVSFASSLIMNDELGPTVAERWLTGFGFIKNPTERMISSVLDIVESRKFPEQSYLAIGSMIHQFCQSSEVNCMNSNSIRSAVEVLMQHLGTNCHSPQTETQKHILLSLHAIGNAGQMTSPGTLRRCVDLSENSMEVRISAVNAYRRMSCGEDRSVLLTTLQNGEEDSELRISSYVNLMHCPTPDLIKNIRNLLEVEQNMQVGSFIWSHLTQITESQDPLKHFIQVLLNGQTFKDFSLDPRKYSRYYEASLFSERMNSGATAEASLVWSPKSFIPRGASLNFTLDLFGQAVNLFEVGGRVQGFESYLQSILEPKAYEKRNSKKSLHPFGSGRSKTEDNGIAFDETQASWYLRVFGKEVVYGNSAFKEPIEDTMASNFISDFTTKFLSSEGYNYHDDSLLINSVHNLPTGVGMPLQVAFNGSVTMDVKAAGKFKMAGLSSAEYMVQAKVIPRASVVITGSMTIDAHIRKTGIATESIAYSSTAISGQVKLSNGGRSVEIEVDSPYNRNMAFNFNHKLLRIEGDEKTDFKTSEIYPDINEYSHCTHKLLGQRLCINKRYNVDRYSDGASPSHIFPMDGELEMSAYMEKTDQGLTKYTLTGDLRSVYENEDDIIPTSSLIRLVFDTPGSVVNRATNLFASYNIPDKQFAARLEQGANILQIQGLCTSNGGQDEVRLSAELNEKIYRFEANVYKMLEEDRKEITASAIIKLPEKSMNADAMLLFIPGKRAQASFEMENVLPTPVVMKIDLQDKTERKDRFSFSGNGKLSIQPFVNTEFLLEMDLKPKMDNMIFNMNYKAGGSPKHTILLHHKRENLGRKGETDWNVYHMLTSSQFTSVNHKVSVSHKYVRGATKSILEIGYGPEIDQPNNPYKLELRQEFNDNSDSLSTKMNGHFSVNFPYADINREARFTHLQSEEVLSTSIDSIVGGTPYNLAFLWKNNAPGSRLHNSTIEVDFPTPYGNLEFVNTFVEEKQNIFVSKSSLSLGEVEDLSFLKQMKIVNTVNNKSIEVFVEKGDGSKIINMYSVNVAKPNYEYISKNFIHLFGYESRGIDVFHQYSQTEGYPTTVNFLKSSKISVGISTTYFSPDTGKHVTFEMNQDDVQKHLVVMKAGYSYVPSTSFDTYLSLNRNKSPLLSSHISLERSDNLLASGNMSLKLENDLLPGNQGLFATFAFDVTKDKQITLSHQLNEKRMRFTAASSDNGVHGTWQHNYYEYLTSASYNVALTWNGLNIIVSSDGYQARVDATATKKYLKVEMAHNNMPSLVKLKVPAQVSLSLEQSAGNPSFRRLRASIVAAQKLLFDLSHDCSHDKSSIVNSKLSMENNLIPILPESAKWNIVIDVEGVEFEAGVNLEAIKMVAKNDLPKSSYVEFSHTTDILDRASVPRAFKIAYESGNQPGVHSLQLNVDDKTAYVKMNYNPEAITGTLNNQGFGVLPETGSVDFTMQIGITSILLKATASWNEDTYSMSISGSSDFRKSAHPRLIPYLELAGEKEYSFVLAENGEEKLFSRGLLIIANEKAGYEYEVKQSFISEAPSDISEKLEITSNDKEFLLHRSIKESGSEIYLFHLGYSPGNIQLNMTSSNPDIPVYLSINFNCEKDHGTVALSLKMQDKVKSVSMSYDVGDDSSFQLQVKHMVDGIESYVPRLMEFSWHPRHDGGEASYLWGSNEGVFRFWKRALSNMGMHMENQDGNLDVQFDYNEGGMSLNASSALEYDGHSYSMKWNGGLQTALENELGKAYFDGDLKYDNLYVLSHNLFELEEKAIFINVTSKQTMFKEFPENYKFVRRISWDLSSSDIDLRVQGSEEDPFFVKVVMTHDEYASASLRMQHRQEDWNPLPQLLVVTLQKTNDEKNNIYAVKLSVSDGDWTRTTVARLQYKISPDFVLLDASVNNDLITQWPVFEQFALYIDGKTMNPGHYLNLNMILDDKKLNVTSHIDNTNILNDVNFDIRCKQNLLNILPQDITFTVGKTPNYLVANVTYDGKGARMKLTCSNTEVDISLILTTNLGTVPYRLQVKWEKELNSFEVNHNLDALAPFPKHFKLQGDVDQDLTNLRIYVDTDEEKSNFSVQKLLSKRSMELVLEHNAEILTSKFNIPKKIKFTYHSLPIQLSIIWDSKEIIMEKLPQGFSFKQNVVNTFPQVISIECSSEMSDPSKSLELKAVVGQYQLQYGFKYRAVEDFDMIVVLNFIDETMLHMNVSTKLTVMEGYELISFVQKLTDALPETLKYSMKYKLGLTDGYVSFTTGLQEPAKIDMTYAKVQDNEFHFGIVHNLEDLNPMLPYETTGDIVITWSDMKKGFDASILSSEERNSFSFSLTTDVQSKTKAISLTIMHDFNALKTHFNIPMTSKLNLYASEGNYDVSVTYAFDSNEKYAKVHLSIEKSEIRVTVNQNIKEPSSNAMRGRKWAADEFPNKISLRLTNADNIFRSMLSFRSGQKRKYLNLMYSTKKENSFELKFNQNLNNILNIQLPAEFGVKGMMNNTAAAFDVNWDEEEYHFNGWLEQEKQTCRVGLKLMNTFNRILDWGIPSDISFDVEKNTDGGNFVLRTLFNVDGHAFNMAIKRPTGSKGAELEVGVESNAVSFSATTKAALHSTGFYIVVTGDQTGLSAVLPNDFFIKMNASQDTATQFTGYASHNIEELQNMGIPKVARATIQLPHFVNSNGLAGGMVLQINDARIEYALNLELMKTVNSMKLQVSGTRPEDLWSLSPSENIAFEGSFSCEIFKDSRGRRFGSAYMYKESTSVNEIVRLHEAQLQLTLGSDSFTLNGTWNVPLADYLKEPINVMVKISNTEGRMTLNSGFSRPDYRLSVFAQLREDFVLHASDGDNTINLAFDKTKEKQLVFSHNLQNQYFEYVPNEVVVSVDMEMMKVSIEGHCHDSDWFVEMQPYRIKAICTTEGIESANIVGEYTTHPSHGITGGVKIEPIDVDISVNAGVQFFQQSDGKSIANVNILNKKNNRGLFASAEVLLKNSNIEDVKFAANLKCNMTGAPLDAGLQYMRETSDPRLLRFAMLLNNYSAKFNLTEDSFSAFMSVPKQYKVKSLLLKGSCRSRESRRESNISLQWNNEKTVSWKMVADNKGHTWYYGIETRQPFIRPKELSGSFQFEKRNRWSIYNITTTADGSTTVVLTKYLTSQEDDLSTHNLVVDIQQSHMGNVPSALITTGVVKYGASLFDNDWKISSDGQDIAVFKNHLEIMSGGFNANIKWKQPFEGIFIGSFDGSLDLQTRLNLIEIDSIINHSVESKYIPKQFTTTGRITYNSALYDSDWKIVSGGQELVVLRKVFKIDADKYKMTVNWKQPFEEFALRFFEIDAVLSLMSDTMDLSVDIMHPFGTDYVPRNFLTRGVIRVGDRLYDSDWKISSGGKNLVILQKSFKPSDNGYNVHFLWKQRYDKFGVTSLDSSLNIHTSPSSMDLTGSLQHNDESHMTVYFDTLRIGNSKNITIGFTCGDKKYENRLYYALERGQTDAAKFTLIYDSLLPESSKLSNYMPSEEHVTISAFMKGLNMHFMGRYMSNWIENPAEVHGMYLISDGNTLLNSSLTFKYAPQSSPPDAELKFVIDQREGITLVSKIPSLRLDQSLNVRYDKSSMRLSISFSPDGQEPFVINVNLKNVVSRFNEVVKSMKIKDMVPKIKIIGNVRHTPYDAYIGLQINDASYTLHLSTGYDSENGYLNITTKRNFVKMDTPLSITAHLVDSSNVRLSIQTSKKLSHFLNYAMRSSAAELKDKVILMTDAMIDMLRSFEGIIDGSESVQMIIDKNKNMVIEQIESAKRASVQFISSTDTVILEYLRDREDEMNSGVLKAVALLSAAMQNLQNIVKRPLQELKHDYLEKVTVEFYEELQPMLKPLIQLLNKAHIGQAALELVQEGITKFVFVMDKNAEAILNAARKPLAELVYVSDTKVVFNVPLHVPVKGLIAPPSASDIAMWIAQSSLANEIEAKLKLLYKARDLYYQYRSILNMPIEELIPPFKGHAEISGFKHVRTFDGKRYNFASDCESEHILVQDIRNNEFRTIIKYGAVPSITVVTSDILGREQSIVLRSDYSVTDENGRDIAVPMQYADVTVTRTGEVVTLHTVYGLTLACNFIADICAVDVSPFYFASLAGMMGTFNNEMNDEYVGPRMSKVDDLAHAWMLPGSCVGNNVTTKCIQSGSDFCIQLFEGQNSDFFSCFAVEDPEPYKQICLSDTCSSTAGVCSAVASYARRCAFRGVNLPLPLSCMTCNSVLDDVFTSEKEITVSGADVVFVVEKSSCLRFRKKDYKRMINDLHSSLNATPAGGNVNYGVVGFGGSESLAQPHLLPFGKKVFLPTARELSNANERALLSALKRGERTNSESDIMQALVYASQLPFRAGAARAIVLITCDVCSSDSEVQRSHVQKLLQDQGIIVHHLRQKNIQAGRNSKKVYGFNTQEIFAKTPGANLARSELKVTGYDQCLPVIDVTGGSVWNSNTIGKESLELVVGEISRGVNRVRRQECVCGRSEYGSATAKCTSS